MSCDNHLKDQRGQAAIEYVLLLVVSVSLLILLMFQIFKPMQAFLQAYMGTYVQCLLEYGELPNLSSDSPGPADSECEAKFEDFTLADGRPPKGGGAGSGRGDESGDGDQESNQAGGSGGRTFAGSGGTGSRRTINTSGRQATAGTESGSQNNTVEVQNGGGFYNTRSSSSASSSTSTSQRRQIIIIEDRLSPGQKKALAKKKEEKRSPVSVGEATEGRGPKKLVVNPPEPKPPVAEEDQEFTLGNFVKILIIAAIIIAIVIFVGGQILQMSKSDSN